MDRFTDLTDLTDRPTTDNRQSIIGLSINRSIRQIGQSKKDSVLDDFPILQMFHDYLLEKLWRDSAVPHAFRIDDNHRTAAAYSEARRFAALHARGSEEEILTLEQRRQLGVERSPSPVRRAEAPRAHEHVTRVRLHPWSRVVGAIACHSR